MKKVVIKLSMNDRVSRCYCFSPQDSHSKAMRLVAGFPGVQSVALVRDQDQIEVTGEIDAANLATLLRKKVGFAEIVSVGEAKKEGGESKNMPSKKKDVQPQPQPQPIPRQEIIYIWDPYPESWCWPL